MEEKIYRIHIYDRLGKIIRRKYYCTYDMFVREVNKLLEHKKFQGLSYHNFDVYEADVNWKTLKLENDERMEREP